MPINNENTGSLQASDGTTLFYREWRHAAPRGAIVLVHGLGEHGGRYAELAGLFHDAGLSVRIHDQRGHGKSDGARGSLRSDADFLTDLKLVFDDFAQQCDTTPFLFGHSLGGLVAARFATGGLSKVRGLLLSSPALAIRMSGFQKILLALTTRLAPGFAVPTSLPAELVSHDTEVVQRYRNDPLNHGKVAARVVNFMLSAMAQVQRDAGTFTLPLLLQIAGDDVFVDPEGSRSFFSSVPQVDKCLYCYDDAYHEIFNESKERRLRVQGDLQSWLVSHLA
ncbi:lysophospholipase [Herbaspirillum sp. meg3]|uniref:alpha/beta hydrolase n=1 Tax=Herbaspirillum sp. meg3 TaxID=2025949 RepID=UPI000B985C5D|nr:alpha/beta hydrolase [Herbaspirillum sp. meg3]ASU38126.1 lysophospholipase [Herbaspirillum sp. meg3]